MVVVPHVLIPLENQSKNNKKNYFFLSLAAVFVLFFAYSQTMDSSYASMENGVLTKYTTNGDYKIEMKWSPSGELKPDTDYFFVIQVKDAVTESLLKNNSFNLEITQNNENLNNYVKEFDSSIFSKKFVFTDSGQIKFILSDINNSNQSIDFSMKLDSSQSSLVDDSGFTSVKRVDGKPQIFACGFEKNAITLQKCFATETYDDYGWFGKVNFLIYAPGWNEEPNKTERIGSTVITDEIKLVSRSDRGMAELGVCDGFVETGPDTGLFVGRVKLSGHDHDANGDGVLDTNFGSTKCKNSPIDEYAKIEAGRKGSLTLSWQYHNDPVKVVSKTINYNWHVGEIEFAKEQYHVDDTLEFTFYDRDMYKVPEKDMDVNFKIYSDSDQSGSTIQVGENYKFKKPFTFTVNSEQKVGDSLYVQNGDTVYVEYLDCTMPMENEGMFYAENDCVEIIAETIVYDY